MINSRKLLIIFFFSISGLIRAQDYPFEVKTVGSGEPLLLLPGFTCTSEVWDSTVEQLSTDYECHLFTLAGFGGVAPIDRPWLPSVRDGLQRYITDKGIKGITVLGHSIGGTLALSLAEEDPDLFKRLVLVDAIPATGALMMPGVDAGTLVYDSPYNQQILDMDDEAFGKMAVGMAEGMTLNIQKREQLAKWIVQSDRPTFVYGFTDLLKLDLRDDLPKIKCPVTILAATHPYGRETVTATYRSQYLNLSKYDIFLAEDSAHFIMYDRPEWFAQKIGEILLGE